MGRQSAFVREDAVRSARDVFWSEGYEGASMASLQRATGLNPSSIYHAFGSKRGLFDAAIEDYLECVVRPGLAPLRAPEVAPGDEVTVLRIDGATLVVRPLPRIDWEADGA